MSKTSQPGAAAVPSYAGWRERMGYSREDAAAALGVPVKTWNAWEEGREKAPRMAGLAMAALALGLDHGPTGETE